MSRILKFIILLLVVAIIVLIIILISNFEEYTNFYLANKEIINEVVEIFILFAALCAALANLGMLQSNHEMATTANNEIKILKLHHDYSISPIIQFIGKSFDLDNINVGNCTSNLALKVTCFAKLDSRFYMSKSYILEKEEKIKFSLIEISNIGNEFNNIYSVHKRTFTGFEEKLNSFLEKDNWLFVVYIDVEGKIHGTSLLCVPHTTSHNRQDAEFTTALFGPAETHRRFTYYIPCEQHFYILSE